MPWHNPIAYAFTRTSVGHNAPAQSGVYGLYNKATWVWVGESDNIRAQLIQHLNGDNVCITLYPNLTFSYELVAQAARGWRQDELIREFHPVCNLPGAR